MSNSSIRPIGKTLPNATNPVQTGLWSDGNEGVLRIPQIFSYTEASPSDYLVSYPGHSLWVVLPFCNDTVGVF